MVVFAARFRDEFPFLNHIHDVFIPPVIKQLPDQPALIILFLSP